jgi:hypothetical protein
MNATNPLVAAFVLVAALLVPVPAAAADRVLLEVDCDDRAKPSLPAFAKQAGIDSPNRAHQVRARAWSEAMRACHRGFDRVQIVAAPDTGEVTAETAPRVAAN